MDVVRVLSNGWAVHAYATTGKLRAGHGMEEGTVQPAYAGIQEQPSGYHLFRLIH